VTWLDGHGLAGEPLRLSLSLNPTHVAALDLDQDSDLDLVTANSIPDKRLSDNVSVFVQDGRRSFGDRRNYAIGKGPVALAHGDLNADARPDLFALDPGSFSVLLNLGSGRLAAALAAKLTGEARAAALADLDADGDLDALVAGGLPGARLTGEPRGGVCALLNDGKGTLRKSFELETGSSPAAITAGDLDGGAGVDLIVSDSGAGGIEVLLNIDTLDGRPARVDLLDERTPPGAHALADLNGDARLELLSSALDEPLVRLRENRGGRWDGEPATFHTLEPLTHLHAADLTGDGLPDVIGRAKSGTRVVWMENVSSPRGPDEPPEIEPRDCAPRRESPFRRGDATQDGRLNLGDAVAILAELFLGKPEAGCADAGDVDDDGRVNLTDAIELLQSLFAGKASPPAPLDVCGPDPTADELGCQAFLPCTP